VAINSIPQQEVAKGNGHREFARASPTALSSVVAKNPDPVTPGGAGANFISLITKGIKMPNGHGISIVKLPLLLKADTFKFTN